MSIVAFLQAYWIWLILIFIIVVLVLPSIRVIGPTEVGLVTKRFARKKLPPDNPIAFGGEAGYQIGRAHV